MTVTLGDLVSQVEQHMRGWTQTTPRYATLNADMDIDSLSISLSVDSEQSRGVVEVGNELIYIESTNPSDFTGVIPAWGRGYDGSPVEEHVIGDKVTFGPVMPRHAIKRTIQQLCATVYPDLYQVGVDVSQTWTHDQWVYPLPDGADRLLSASWHDSLTDLWYPMVHFRMDEAADEGLYPSTRTVTFLTDARPTATLKLTYQAPLGIPTEDTDDLVEATGAPDGIDQVLLWGSLAHLEMGPELAMKQVNTAEQSDRQRYVSQGSSVAASRYLMGLYTNALQQCRRRLLERHPTRIVRTY